MFIKYTQFPGSSNCLINVVQNNDYYHPISFLLCYLKIMNNSPHLLLYCSGCLDISFFPFIHHLAGFWMKQKIHQFQNIWTEKDLKWLSHSSCFKNSKMLESFKTKRDFSLHNLKNRIPMTTFGNIMCSLDFSFFSQSIY